MAKISARSSLSYRLLMQNEAASRRMFRDLIRSWSLPALQESYFRYSAAYGLSTGWQHSAGMPPSFYRVRRAAVRNEIRSRAKGGSYGPGSTVPGP